MSINLDANKIKIKYKYGFYKLLPSYPTVEDALYECILFISSYKPENLFTLTDFKELKLKIPKGFRSKRELLQHFIRNQYFIKVDKQMYKVNSNIMNIFK